MLERKIYIGGKERCLKFTARAIAAIEQELKIPCTSKDFFDNNGLHKLAVFMWGGLLHEDKRLTLDSVFDWMPASIVDCFNLYQEPVLTVLAYDLKSSDEQKKTSETEQNQS